MVDYIVDMYLTCFFWPGVVGSDMKKGLLPVLSLEA